MLQICLLHCSKVVISGESITELKWAHSEQSKAWGNPKLQERSRRKVVQCLGKNKQGQSWEYRINRWNRGPGRSYVQQVELETVKSSSMVACGSQNVKPVHSKIQEMPVLFGSECTYGHLVSWLLGVQGLALYWNPSWTCKEKFEVKVFKWMNSRMLLP